MVADLPRQLRWAADLDEPEIGDLSPAPASSGVVVAGMGGSALAGDVAALTAHQLPVLVHRGYGVPAWAGPARSAVVAVSYSGNTEETLSALHQAAVERLAVAVVASGGAIVELAATEGWPTVVVPGGLQPRAAVGYQAGALLRLLTAMGGIGDARPALREAAAVVEARLADAVHDDHASQLAARLVDRTAVAYGVGPLAAVAARRLKTQINENAKLPAFHGDLPEANHNDIEGWGAAEGRFGVVILRDSAESERLATRAILTESLLGDTYIGTIRASGNSELARVLSLIATADLLSLELATMRGVDPEPVPILEDFKLKLREE